LALLTDKMITDEFVADVRQMSFLPAVQQQWSHQQILDVAYHTILTDIATPLTQVDHGFYREADDTTLVASQAAYDIPSRAMLSKIYLAQLIDTSENIGKLEHVQPPEQEFFNETTAGHPRRIRIDSAQVTLNPAPSSGDIVTWDTLRLWIYRRPSRPVRQTTSGSNAGRCAVVSSVNSGTGVVTYTADTPSDFNASSVHDFYSATSRRRIGTAITATAKPANGTQTFSTTTAALLSAGDYVCMRDETCLIPVPSHEFLEPLRDLTIAKIAATQKDTSRMESALGNLARQMKPLMEAASTRLQNNLPAISLLHSPFVRGLRGGKRMIRE
jgi:hypothetical protein